MPQLRANLVSVYLLRPAPQGGVELLTLQRSQAGTYPGIWQAVHGHIEEGETAWQAAARELEEESEIAPRRWFRSLTLETFYAPETDTIYFTPMFVAEAAAGAACRISNEHQAFAWRSLDEARAVFPWDTQHRTLDVLAAHTRDWPQPGSALQPIDLAQLARGWSERPSRPAARGVGNG